MTRKFINVRVDQATRDAFQKKAKMNGVTMSELIKNWINQYLAEETVTVDHSREDHQAVWERLEALEKKLENSLEDEPSRNQETEEKLTQYIQYLDQRVDTLETVVINPLKEEFQDLKQSWTALFNQVRGLEENLNKLNTNLETVKQKTKEQFTRITQYINQKLSE